MYNIDNMFQKIDRFFSQIKYSKDVEYNHCTMYKHEIFTTNT